MVVRPSIFNPTASLGESSVGLTKQLVDEAKQWGRLIDTFDGIVARVISSSNHAASAEVTPAAPTA